MWSWGWVEWVLLPSEAKAVSAKAMTRSREVNRDLNMGISLTGTNAG